MLRKPRIPPDILTTLCAITNLLAEDPKKVEFIQRRLADTFDLKTTLTFAKNHNKVKNIKILEKHSEL